jgi:hypothetical protein
VDSYSWEANVKAANAQIARVCETLRVKGIEVAADVYAGSLKKLVRSHALNGHVDLIISRAAMDNWIGRLLDNMMSIFRSFKAPSIAPVMLISPRTLV